MDISENIINKKIQFNFKGFFSKRLLIYSFLMFSFLTIFLQTKNKVNFFGFAIKNWKVVDLTSQQTVHGYVIKDNDANYPKTSGVDGVWIRAALTLKNGGGTRNIDVVTSTCNGDSTCFCDRGQRCAGHFTFSYDANETQSIEVSTLSLPSGYSSSTAKYPECCFTRYYAGCRIDPRCGVASYTKVRLPTPAVPLLAPLTFFIHNDSVVGPTPTPIQQSCGNSIKNEDNVLY